MCRFSIVIPVYNNPAIDRCLYSVLNQTYNDFELIVINDGSDDSTLDIINSVIKNDERAKVLSFENGGLATARNRGIDASSGEYIWMIDSDDYIEHNALEMLNRFIEQHGSDLIMIDYYVVDEQQHELNNAYLKTDLKELPETGTVNDLLVAYLDRKIHSYAWAYVAKRRMYKNIKYPDGKNYEDLRTTYKVFQNVNKMGVFKHKVYYYVQTQNSITHTINEKNILDFYEAGKEMCSKLENDKSLNRKAKMFYVGIVVNSYFNMYKINKAKAYPFKLEFRNYMKQNSLYIYLFLRSNYFFKIVLLSLWPL